MNNEVQPLEAEAPDFCTNERHRITVLSGVYLEAGLPLDLAARAAIADYELFEDELLCV